MLQVIVEATNKETLRVARKKIELEKVPDPGEVFHLRDYALDGLVIAESVRPAQDEIPARVIVHENDRTLDRMISSGWSAEALAA